MKKLLVVAAAALVVGIVSGCGSSRTPRSGANSNWVHYNCFFGMSIESAVFGDGFFVK